ncbi:MAG: hypothetical protein GY953_11305, partial [bacterium]|nr:hypothetical protein [bacterium]
MVLSGVVAFLALGSVADCVPARWSSADPGTVALLRQTPVKCVLMEEYSAEFVSEANSAGIAVYGVARSADAAKRVAASGANGIVVEGDFDYQADGKPVVELRTRAGMRLDAGSPVVGSLEGVWPGINTAEDGSAKAAPTGAPWIDTNSGFARFVRTATGKTVWIGNRPPEAQVIPVARYLQAIGDAEMVGAHWVLALDSDFERRLLDGEAKARESWQRIGAYMQWWSDHREWASYQSYRGLAVIQDPSSRPLLSGGILDMIAARHTPLRSIPAEKLDPNAMEGAVMAVNVSPASTTAKQKEILLDFTRGGATLLTGPPGWEFPPIAAGQVTMDEKHVEKLDDIWHGVNSMTGRQNLGVRLFNVASMR